MATNLATRWRALRNHLGRKYGPSFVEWLVHRSTAKARRKLAGMPTLSILIDNTVLYHGVTHESAWIPTGTKLWGGKHPIETGYSARVPVHPYDAETREYKNIVYLAGLAHLAKIGAIKIFTSAELDDEQFRQPAGRYRGYGYFDLSLFPGRLKSIDGIAFSVMGPSYLNLPSAEAQQRERLSQNRTDKIYDGLVRALGEKNSQDAWHIYTADKYGMFCFLTMDFKLLNTLSAQSGSNVIRSLNTKVISPEELGKYLGIAPIPPILLSYRDASFRVRADLSLPDAKRAPLKAYKKRK
jgi:hypothetical protein